MNHSQNSQSNEITRNLELAALIHKSYHFLGLSRTEFFSSAMLYEPVQKKMNEGTADAFYYKRAIEHLKKLAEQKLLSHELVGYFSNAESLLKNKDFFENESNFWDQSKAQISAATVAIRNSKQWSTGVFEKKVGISHATTVAIEQNAAYSHIIAYKVIRGLGFDSIGSFLEAAKKIDPLYDQKPQKLDKPQSAKTSLSTAEKKEIGTAIRRIRGKMNQTKFIANNQLRSGAGITEYILSLMENQHTDEVKDTKYHGLLSCLKEHNKDENNPDIYNSFESMIEYSKTLPEITQKTGRIGIVIHHR